MAPKDLKAAQNNELFDSALYTINKAGSTGSEKMHLIDLRYHVGQVIKYGDPNQPKHVIKVAPREYVDLVTRMPVAEKELAPYLGSATHSKAVTFAEITRNTSKEKLRGFMKPANKSLVVDFETAIRPENVNMERHHLFSMGLAEMVDNGHTLKGREFFFTDVFEQIVKGGSQGEKALESYRGMLFNKNLKAGYFKQFTKLADKTGINMSGINSLEALVENKKKLQQILKHVNTSEMTEELLESTTIKSAKVLGASKHDIKAGLASIEKARRTLETEYGIGLKTDFSSPVAAAANPGGVDLDAFGVVLDEKTPLKLTDMRGHQLFVNSTVMPTLVGDMTTTMGPQINQISHRLNMSKAASQTFRETMSRGISSQYGLGSSAEDMESLLRYSLGYDRKLTFRKTAHGALNDSVRELSVLKLQEEFSQKSIKQMLHPELTTMPLKARFQSGWLALNAANAEIKNSFQMTAFNKSMISSAKGNMINKVTNSLNMKHIEKQVQSRMERSMSYRIEKNMLSSNIRQFGGTTIAHLLGGAMLFAGVRGAVQKAKERLADSKDKRMEGMGHESIMTNIRRLAMTDFGSGFIPGGRAIMKMMKTLFRTGIKNPDGMAAQTKAALTRANKQLSAMTTKKTLWGKVKETLTDQSIFNETSKYLLNTNTTMASNTSLGVIPSLIYKHTHGKFGKFLEGGVKKAETLAEIYSSSLLKHTNNIPASKRIQTMISKGVSGMLVDKSGKLKAPAIAMAMGGAGALGIMLSRGSYDPSKMMDPMPNKLDNKYSRKGQHWGKTRQTIRDIRNSSMEGLPLGSRDREARRLKNTDFGSGRTTIVLRRLLDLAGKVAEKTRKVSTVMAKRFKDTYATGKKMKASLVNKSIAHDQKIAASVATVKASTKGTTKALTSHNAQTVKIQPKRTNVNLQGLTASARKRPTSAYATAKMNQGKINKLGANTTQADTRGILNKKPNAMGTSIHKQRSMQDIGKLGSENQTYANQIAATEGRSKIMKTSTMSDYKQGNLQRQLQKVDNTHPQIRHNKWRQMAEETRMNKGTMAEPPKVYTPKEFNYDPLMMPKPVKSNIGMKDPFASDYMYKDRVGMFTAGTKRQPETIMTTGIGRPIVQQNRMIPKPGRNKSVDMLKDMSARSEITQGPVPAIMSTTTQDQLRSADRVVKEVMKGGKNPNQWQTSLPYIAGPKTDASLI